MTTGWEAYRTGVLVVSCGGGIEFLSGIEGRRCTVG